MPTFGNSYEFFPTGRWGDKRGKIAKEREEIIKGGQRNKGNIGRYERKRQREI